MEAMASEGSALRKGDLRWMGRALELAAKTVGLASPNPQVGCVLVRAGREGADAAGVGDVVIGEGAHRYDERDHAEVVALRQAAARSDRTQGDGVQGDGVQGDGVRGDWVRGATAYVTLEPCSHQGRTGPCAEALIAAGVARCVVATVDPNPLVSGQGIAKLRAAGVAVTVRVMQEEARAINDGFAQFIQHGRPLVTLKAALSVDGMLAPAMARRRAAADGIPAAPFWLTGEPARAEVHRLRHAADAILTGIGTVLADDPELTDRSERSGARRRPLLRVVLDSRLRIPLRSRLVATAKNDLLIVCGSEAPVEKIAALAAHGVEVVPVVEREGRPSLAGVLRLLGSRQILNLLLECGSALNGAFLAQGLVDRVVLFYAETELGADAVPFAAGAASPFLLEQRLGRVRRTSFVHGSGQDACVSGYLTDPWVGADAIGLSELVG